MMYNKAVVFTVAACGFLSACDALEDMETSFSSEKLRSVRVGGIPYAVERRSETLGFFNDAVIKVAVWATVRGELVYCGKTRAECAAAIREHLAPPVRQGM